MLQKVEVVVEVVPPTEGVAQQAVTVNVATAEVVPHILLSWVAMTRYL